MSVRCPQCFYENEERYRFCGMCGIALPRIGAASEPEVKVGRAATAAINTHPEPPLPPGREILREPQREPFREPIQGKERPSVPVTGPSFLGLSQDQNPYPDRSRAPSRTRPHLLGGHFAPGGTGHVGLAMAPQRIVLAYPSHGRSLAQCRAAQCA